MQAPPPEIEPSLEALAADLLRAAKAQRLSIVTAESCTGGFPPRS